MAIPSSYSKRPSLQGVRRSFTTPVQRPRTLHEQLGLDDSDADAKVYYAHPNVKIISFTPPKPTSNENISIDADYPVDTIETLPWQSNTEQLEANGRMVIEKVRGSTIFLKCQQIVYSFLRNTQCWCVDNEARFVLRRGPFQYARIELPCADESDKERVEDLKKVLPLIIKYETTPCPFVRGFSVLLPEDAITPRRKGTWKRRDSSQPGLSDSEYSPHTPVSGGGGGRRLTARPPPSAYPRTGPGYLSPSENRPGQPSSLADDRTVSPAGTLPSDDDLPSEDRERHRDDQKGREEENRGRISTPRQVSAPVPVSIRIASIERSKEHNLRNTIPTLQTPRRVLEKHQATETQQETGTSSVDANESPQRPLEQLGQVSTAAAADELQQDDEHPPTTSIPAEEPVAQQEESGAHILPMLEQNQMVPSDTMVVEEHVALDEITAPVESQTELQKEENEVHNQTLSVQKVEATELPVPERASDGVSMIHQGLDKPEVSETDQTGHIASAEEQQQQQNDQGEPHKADASGHLHRAGKPETEREYPLEISTDSQESRIASDESTNFKEIPQVDPASTIVNEIASVPSSEADTGDGVLGVEGQEAELVGKTQDGKEDLVPIQGANEPEREPHIDNEGVAPSADSRRDPYSDDQVPSRDEHAPEQIDGASNDQDDAMSVVSSTDSFHTMSSHILRSTSDVDFDTDKNRLAESSLRPSISHRREISEATVTTATFSDTPDEAMNLGFSETDNDTPLANSVISVSSHPEPTTPIPQSVETNLRQRLQARRSFSPMPPPSIIVTNPRVTHHQPRHDAAKAILQTVVVKPLELVFLVAHVIARIIAGAPASELISGDLFRRPPSEHRRRVSGFADQLNGNGAGGIEYLYDNDNRDDDVLEDDYGVPIRGRRRRASRQPGQATIPETDETLRKGSQDDDTESFLSVD